MSSCASSSLSDNHWQFVMHDDRQMISMLKISSMLVSNEMLHTIDWHGTLLSNEHYCDHEVVRVDCSEECGYCTVHDERIGKNFKIWFSTKQSWT